MSESLERPASRLPAPIRALRPRQWVKNFLVVLAPLAAGRLFEPAVLRGVALAFVAFCLVSSAVYLLNDIRDVEEDRLHPRKRFRPIAAGELSVPVAAVLGLILGIGGLALGYLIDPALGITLVVYVGIQILYSAVLKHLPVIDLAVVSSGFLLRAIAGGVAVGVALSQWFLLVAAFGSLFMVAGKRYSELRDLGAEAGTRASLERYTDTYLRLIWSVSIGVVIMSYSLWAFDVDLVPLWGVPWTAISIAPFTLAILRYAMKIDAGDAGAPEDVVMSDRILQILGVLWLIPVTIAVFA